MAEALYRKYRPQVFEDVVGQEPIERTLKNAIAQDKVSHAYLFCGPRGTGKTTTARLLAKALLCQTGPTPDPDGTCEDCQLIADGVHPDVYELDAASRTGVENVREEIISRVQFAPTRGRNKVYIIDEVHMLSVPAFNALLKTLEEPPSHVVFVLCTTDPQKVPETIHSRCQRFDFRRIAPESMVSRLGAICIAEGVEFEGEALDLIAHRAEGGLRNALTSLEQIIAFENGKVTLAGAERLLGSIDSNDMAEIVSYVGRRDVANCFRWTAEYVETGADLAQFVRDMAEHVRNLYVLALVGDEADLDINETTRRELTSELQWFGPDRLARLMGVLGDLSSELKTSSNPRLAFEIALTRMVRPDSDLTLAALAERVEALESGYSAVAHVLPGQPLGAGVPVAEAGVVRAAAPEAAAFEPAADRPAAQEPSAGEAATGRLSGNAAAQPQAKPAVQMQPQPQPQPESQRQVAAAGAELAASAPAATASVTAASVAAVAASGGDDGLAVLANQASMQRIWQSVLSAVKKQKQAYGVLFMNAKARFDADGRVVRISFPAEAAFAFSAVQKPDVQEALAAAFQKAVGVPVAFLLEQAGQEGATSAAMSTQAANIRIEEAPVEPVVAVREQPAAAAIAHEPVAHEQPMRSPVADDFPPYEDVPYEEVPYEELYGASSPVQAQPPVAEPALAPEPAPAPAVTSQQARPDTATSASPVEPNLTPDGAIAEDPSDVEALLQAGFGGAVVFSEVEE